MFTTVLPVALFNRRYKVKITRNHHPQTGLDIILFVFCQPAMSPKSRLTERTFVCNRIHQYVSYCGMSFEAARAPFYTLPSKTTPFRISCKKRTQIGIPTQQPLTLSIVAVLNGITEINQVTNSQLLLRGF